MTVTIHTFLATESLQCLEWANVLVKALEPEIQELKPWFSHLLAGWPEAHCLPSLGLSFHICKTDSQKDTMHLWSPWLGVQHSGGYSDVTPSFPFRTSCPQAAQSAAYCQSCPGMATS